MLKLVGLAMALTMAVATGAGAGEVVKHRAGGDPSTSHKSPSRSKFESITLERGVTHDRGFANWAAKTHHPKPRPRRRHGR